MLQTLINAFKVKEIRRKVYMMLLLLLVFRIGCFIPVPGLNRSEFATAISGNDFLTLMSSITGGALSQGTVFALGIGPYINASIIMQLLSVGIPALERLSNKAKRAEKRLHSIPVTLRSYLQSFNPSVLSSALAVATVRFKKNCSSVRNGLRACL